MGRITTKFFSKVADHTYPWVCPDGVTSVTVFGVGAGGTGGIGSASGGAGGGGAGGAFARTDAVTVVPGTSYSAIIPGTAAANSNGGDSTFTDGVTVFLCAKGGQRGTAGPAGAGGTGSTTGCIGDLAYAGGNGAAGATASGGGGGAAGTNGVGANASTWHGGLGTGDYGGDGGPGVPSGTGGGTGGATSGGGGGGGLGTVTTGGAGHGGVIVLTYEVSDDMPDGVVVVACDSFTGGNVANIQARSFDGCGDTSAGEWGRDDFYDTGTDALFILDSTVGGDHAREIQYTDSGVDCTTDSVSPNFQGRTAWLQFPNYDTVSVAESCTLIWEDSFAGAAGDLAGRVTAGGSAGTGTWVRDDGGAGPGIQLDGTGRVYFPGGVSPNGNAVYRITGLTLPADYDAEIDVERTSFVLAGGDSNGNVGIPVRMQDPLGTGNGELNYWFTYSTLQDPPLDDDQHGLWRARCAQGPIGTVVTGSASADPPGDHGIDKGETRTIRVKVRGTGSAPATCTTYLDATCTTGKVAATYFDGQFGWPRGNYNSGPPGLRMETGTHESSYRVKAIRIYSHTPAVSGTVFTDAYAYVLLRASEDDEVGYQVILEGYRDGSGVFQLEVAMWEYGGFVSGLLATALRRNQSVLNGIALTQDEPYKLDAWVADDPTTGNATITARVNGIVVQRFDLMSDTPDGYTTNLPDNGLHTGGTGGLGVYDADYQFDHTLRDVLVSRYEALCIPATDTTTPPPSAECGEGTPADALLTLNYTSADVPITYQGEVYEPFIAHRTPFRLGTGERSASEIDLSIPMDHPVATLVQTGLPRAPVGVIVYRLDRQDLTDGAAAIPLQGQVTKHRIEGRWCILTLGNVGTLLTRKLPRMLTQRSCPHVLYGPFCQKSSAGFTVTGLTVNAIQGRVINIVGATTVGDPTYFEQGVLVTSTGLREFIEVQSGDSLTLKQVVPGLEEGDTVSLIAGCDHLASTCDTRFTNILHFGGEIGIQSNPATGAGLVSAVTTPGEA